jgi:hypothetical protein
MLQLNKFATKRSTVESYISFAKFIEFLESRLAAERGARAEFYKQVLARFESCPELKANITLEQSTKYSELFETVLSVVLPFTESKEEALVGFGNALSTDVFYSTTAFHKSLDPYCNCENEHCLGGKELALQVHEELQYNFILKELYGVEAAQQKEWIHSFVDPQTGLYKYYRLNIDTRFVEIQPKTVLPVVDEFVIKSHLACDNGFAQIEQLLPLQSFTASGFTIITLTDVTAQQAVEQIGKVVLDLNDRNTTSAYERVRVQLQTLVGSNKFSFGIMPFFTVNNRAAILYENFPYSIMVKACWDAGVSKEELAARVNLFMQKPALITFDAAVKNDVLSPVVQQALRSAGIVSYTLVPVYYNGELVGISETAATFDAPAGKAFQLNNIKAALPYISQLLRMYIDKFNIAIEAIVKDKFTNVQPAVQWKFNEVAWHYFRSNQIEQKNLALEKIVFSEVYPHYGAVDIRNSTIKRNKALREDYQYQLSLVINIFGLLKSETRSNLFDSILLECNEWLLHLTHHVTIEEVRLEDFFKNKVYDALKSYSGEAEKILKKIDFYFESLDEKTGIVFQKRQEIETSIGLINTTLANYFNNFKDKLQLLFPSYFETYRTDGIEYDIYMGQSFAPKLSFDSAHLQKLRLWQLESMAAVALMTKKLLPQMINKLETTQLLFVNSRAIDITFRNDERRFDVEGTYNIRYHIVKKRIDKVHIANTTERLTQPGKIAIVYIEDNNASEYIGYIKQLQQKQFLLDDLEYLELEELQGVTGLKALRVGVSFNQS